MGEDPRIMPGAKSGRSRTVEGREGVEGEAAEGKVGLMTGGIGVTGSCRPKATRSTSPDAVRGISACGTGRTNISGKPGPAEEGGKTGRAEEGGQAFEAAATRQLRMHKPTARRSESPMETITGKLSIWKRKRKEKGSKS